MTENIVDDEGSKYLDLIKDIAYFNLEISICKTALVINASPKGIDAFLERLNSHGRSLELFSFADLGRPTRRWFSRKIEENEEAGPNDPSPYKGGASNMGMYNDLVNKMYIDTVKEDSQNVIFCIGLRDHVPILIMNDKGKQQFLDILQTLRDKCYWFFVTKHNPKSDLKPRFCLDDQYYGDSKDHVFTALECIRLEPEERIFLDCSVDIETIEKIKIRGYQKPGYFGFPLELWGNSAGLLLFSSWIHNFAISADKRADFQNRWNNRLTEQKETPDDRMEPSTSWLHLRKIEGTFQQPIFSFEAPDDGSRDLYIFGNPRGFEELSQITEEYAFSSDHDEFYDIPLGKMFRGCPRVGVFGPQHFRSFNGWQILGGGFFNPAYNPQKNYSLFDAKMNHVNTRILL